MSGIKPIIALAFLMLFAGLACSLPARGTPPPIPTLIPTLDPQVLEDQLATAAAGFRDTGQIDVSFSEEQITSIVAQALTQQPDLPVTEPQVSLQNGQMVVTGKVKVGFITTPVEIVFEPSVQNGDLQVNVLSANFGSLPIPENALDQISTTMNQNLSQYIAVEGRAIEVESVAIADGTLTLTGNAR